MTNTRPKPGPRRSSTSTIPVRQRKSDSHRRPKRRTKSVQDQRRRIEHRRRTEQRARDSSFDGHEEVPAPSGASVRLGWALLGLIVFLTVAVVALLEASLFEVQDVSIVGNSQTNDGLILETLSVPVDQALLLYDIDASTERISDLPWVREVEITRNWPSTLRVIVREHRVAAALGRPDGSEWLVLAESGIVVERRFTPPSSVPLIIGTDQMVNSAQIGEPVPSTGRALEIVLDVPRQLDGWITTWSLDTDGVLIAELVGSAQANFGAFEDPRTQFVSLASILDGGAELTCLRRIDLAVPDTPVLYRDTACIIASYENT